MNESELEITQGVDVQLYVEHDQDVIEHAPVRPSRIAPPALSGDYGSSLSGSPTLLIRGKNKSTHLLPVRFSLYFIQSGIGSSKITIK
jgi:hypothetical protein